MISDFNPIQVTPNPFLAVAVITRHRPDFVEPLVRQLIEDADLCDPNGGVIRIYVSDSSDDDRTRKALEPLVTDARGRLVLRRASQSFDSGENHLDDLLTVVTGEYVWTLADDEILQVGAFGQILDLLKSNCPEIVVINPPLVSKSGEQILHQYHVGPDLYGNGKLDYVTTYKDIVRNVGFIHLTTMISAVVCKLSLYRSIDWATYLRDSPLYAHAMVQIAVFHKRKAIFTRRPIFCYRLGAEDWCSASTFLRLSEKRSVSAGYFFHASIISFLKECVDKGYMTRAEAMFVREIHWEQRCFLLLNFCTDVLIQSLVDGIEAKAISRYAASPKEVASMRSFVPYLPMTLRAPLEEALAMTSEARDMDEEGRIAEVASPERIQNLRGKFWHAYNGFAGQDQTYSPPSNRELFLAKVVPPFVRQRVGEALCAMGLGRIGMAMLMEAPAH